jgi:hypothetical protein
MSKGKSVAGWIVISLITTLPFLGLHVAKAATPEPKPEPEPGPEPQPPAPPIAIPPFTPLPPLEMPEWPEFWHVPEYFPSAPSVPTEPPRERARPKTVTFKALHRYEVTVDVLPVKGVSLRSLAEFVIPYLRMTDPDFAGTATVERNGHQVTRVRMTVNSLFTHEEPIERERSFAGVGSIWIVSAKDLGEY